MDCLSLDEEDKFVKILQEYEEETHVVTGLWQMKTVEFKPEQPKSITLLLHGYNERGLRIYRKLKRALPADTYIIAPNGPFPMPRPKADRLDFGYAWNFYDDHNGQYHVDEHTIVSLIKNLIDPLNPEKLPITIIGFSQGGFLAPLLAYGIPEVKHVIGIGCIFRPRFFPRPATFTLDAIHGASDAIVSSERALQEIEVLKNTGINVNWHSISDLKHEINLEVIKLITTLTETYGKESL